MQLLARSTLVHLGHLAVSSPRHLGHLAFTVSSVIFLKEFPWPPNNMLRSFSLIALAVGWFMQQRTPDVPTAPVAHTTPEQVDRADFVRPDAPWLVIVFTSETCETCAKVWTSTQLVESNDVAIQNVEVGRDKQLHDRYNITAVPAVVVADAAGVAQASFLGPPSSADLWAKLAELRDADAPT